MESKRIPDESITASSQKSDDHSPSFARVDSPKAWCSKPDDKSPYIQIQLDEPKLITAITTQGSSRKTDLSWSRKYEVKYLEKGNWKSYKEVTMSVKRSGLTNCSVCTSKNVVIINSKITNWFTHQRCHQIIKRRVLPSFLFNIIV